MKRLLMLLLSRAHEASLEVSTCYSEDEMTVVVERNELDEDKTVSDNVFGLCILINNMCDDNEITLAELSILLDYLYNNKPKRLHNNDHLVSQNRFFWLPGNWTPRIKWIEKHILLT